MPIDFTLTDEQKALRGIIRDYCRNTLEPLVKVADRETDPQKTFATLLPAYEKAYDLGLAFGFLPPEYGGVGSKNVDATLIVEEINAIDAGFSSVVGINGLAGMPLLWYGTEAQKNKWFRLATSDASRCFLISWCCSERAGTPGGTANYDSPYEYPAGVQTTAELRNGEWVINGRKFWPTCAAGWDMKGADLNVVVCRVDRKLGGTEGLGCMLVPRGTPGVRFEEIIDKMGHRTSQNAYVVFDDVRIPEENAFAIGRGDEVVARAWSWTGAFAGIASVGVARAAYEYTLDWCKTYTAGGRDPIIHHQNVGYMLTDIAMRIEASRYMCWKAAHYGDTHDNETHIMGPMAKIFASETCTQVVYDCMRVMGMNSYDRTHPMEKYMRDILCFPIYDGGNMGMRRRMVWGVMADPAFDPRMLADNGAIPYRKSMEGLGTVTHPPLVGSR